MQNSIKHIFSDVDGTLIHTVNNHPNFDERLIERINDLHKYNLSFTIATGRHYKDILEMMKKNRVEYINYIIGMAGAQIYDYSNKEEVFNRIFNENEKSEFHEVYEYLKENYFNQFTVFIYSFNMNKVDSINIINDGSKVFYHYIDKYLMRMASNIDYLKFQICKSPYEYENIYKTAFYFYDEKLEKSPELLLKVKNELSNKFNMFLDYVQCGPNYLEICLKGIDKGSAIKFINEKYLKSDYSQMICFGDSDNDASMFKLIPNSVTRINAPESIKKLAKHIIDNHPSTFVLEGIDKLILNKG